MEEQRFDDLTRLVAGKTSRRQVLKVLAGAAVGGLFAGRLSPVMAAPKCHRDGLGCDTNSNCCSGYCVNGKCAACPSGGVPCNYGPCNGIYGTFAGGTVCCAAGETCSPDPSNSGYGVCTCGAVPGVNDCPSGMSGYASSGGCLCYPNTCPQ